MVGWSGLARAVEVRDVRWGFNGAYKRHAFNLCTIELLNPSTEAFQGDVTLTKEGGIGSSEAPLVESKVYIPAGETRTVQFLPFIASDRPDWRVSWGPSGADSFELPRVDREFTAPVAVQLFADQGVSSPLRGVAVFPDSDFPIGAPGTETLGSVVLDHIPRWDSVRSRAFRDWLGKGGQIYLINGRDGQRLTFPAPLEDLNVPADRFMVGQGIVTRHSISQDAAQIPGLIAEVAPADTDPNNYGNQYSVNGSNQLFQTMRNMVRPDHNWTLIFFLALVYLLILFPGIWLVGRKRGDFRLTYTMILGTVLLFSWFYAEIGKRGYGESTGLREMMVAYPLGNQRVALQKYGSLFVTEGGPYAIPAHGEGAVFTLESGTGFSGNAEIQNRPQAVIGADIPPFSACSYQESSVLQTQGDYSITVKTLDLNPDVKRAQDALKSAIPPTDATAPLLPMRIAVQLGAGVPGDAQVYWLPTTQGSTRVGYTLTKTETGWVNTTPATTINNLFPTDYYYGYGRIDVAQQKKNLIAYLVQIATSTELTPNYDQAPSTPAPDSTAPFEGGRILVYCDAPAEFLRNEYPASGKVLFVSKVDPSMVTTAAPAAP